MILHTPFSLSFLYIKQERGQSERTARVLCFSYQFLLKNNKISLTFNISHGTLSVEGGEDP